MAELDGVEHLLPEHLGPQLYAAVVASLRDGVVVQARDGRVLAMNPAAGRLLGLTAAELSGCVPADPAWRTVHADGSPMAPAEYPARVVLATGEAIHGVTMGVHKPDGSLTWLLANAEPVPQGDAGAAVLSVFVDQTMEHGVRRSILAAASSTDDAIVQYGPGGTIVWASPTLAKVFGYRPADVVGRTFRFVAEGDRDEVDRIVQEAVLAGEDRVAVRTRAQRADGSHFWTDARVNLLREADGSTLGCMITYRDITEQQAVIDELARTREEYRLIAENASDVVVQFSAAGVMEWVSPSVDRVLGWSPDELVGRRADDFLHPDERDRRLATIDSATGGVPDSGPVRVRGRDGAYRWLDGVVTPLADSGGPTKVVIGFRDVHAQVDAERAAARAEQMYRLLAENASDVVILTGASDTIEWVSPSVGAVLGWEPGQLLGRPVKTFVHPDDLEPMRPDVLESDGERPPMTGAEMRVATADGRWLWVHDSRQSLYDDGGRLIGSVDSLRSIDEAVRARQALQQSERLFRTAMQEAAIGMVINGMDLSFREVNQAFCRLVGRDEAWLLDHQLTDVMHPDDMVKVQADFEELIAGDRPSSVARTRLLRPDGELVWTRAAVVIIRDSAGDPDFLLAQVEDVTVETAAQEQLAYQAFHDPLTGLRNRTWVLDILEVDLRAAKRRGTSVGVLFIDLDNFKVVNDSLGHAAGDEVLATVADRVTSALRSGDRVGRFGGDEFIVVVPDVSDPHEVERVAERVSSAIATDLRIEGHRIVPTASIGIALSTAVSTPESLLRDTDSALYRAKDAGRGRWQFFDDVMHDRAVSRLTVEDQLRDAVARGEFVVHYQPIVRLHDRSTVGHEALVRWQHPTRGLLFPDSFLEVAEESGVITALGRQVLDHVCRLIAGTPCLVGPVSVNVSAVELAQADWLEQFLAVVDDHGVAHDRIVVEVTETAVMSMLDPTRKDLVALRHHGFGLHVDDFGTGFSSISLLRDLPVNGLKLDRRFVHDLTPDESPANALAHGLAGLVEGLNLVGVAEGVETEVQAAMLLEQGWSHGQGFLFAQPAPQPALG